MLVIPILGKLAYTLLSRREMKVGASLAFGAYVINSRITGTITHTYVEDSSDPMAPFKKGEEGVLEQTMSTTVCTPGGEFSIELSLPISTRISIGLSGSLGYIGKTAISVTPEFTGYAPKEWTPAASELTSLKEQREIGGLSYGGRLSLNLFF